MVVDGFTVVAQIPALHDSIDAALAARVPG